MLRADQCLSGANGAVMELLLVCSFNRVNGCSLAILAHSLVSQNTVFQSVQCVITADSYIQTGMNSGSALSVENVASLNKLSVCSLGTQSLGIGVTAVLGGAHSFVVCEELKT